MGKIGGILGRLAGGVIGRKLGGAKGEAIAGAIGGELGNIAPGFKTGGRVKRTGKALVHKGEYVLPKGVKPTKAQRDAVAKKKRKLKNKLT